jgi:aminomethyltransferase
MQTALYAEHQRANAHMVEFADWQMPLHYGSALAEHQHVRVSVGMFDVSHMGILDIEGGDATYFLRYVLANDVKKLSVPGSAFYTCLLNNDAGIIDDAILYFLNKDQYRLVVNAGSCQRVLKWLRACADRYDVVIHHRQDLGILALQGPDARQRLFSVLGQEDILKLRPFTSFNYSDYCIACTGYTGEDGFEIIAPAAQLITLWKRLLKLGVPPCGLAARDILRLEAGFNLYGQDMDETVTPLEANLAWTVAWNDEARQFIGKDSLLNQIQQGVTHHLVGVKLLSPGILRAHDEIVFSDQQVGVITSAVYSPILGCSIGFARVPVNTASRAQLSYRGKQLDLEIADLPFLKIKK